MKHSMKCRFKNVKLLLTCLGILAVMILPGQGYASSSTFGLADITWDYLTFTYTDASGIPIGDVSWLDPADPTVDTRSYFGSAWVGLNGAETDPGLSSAIEGTWQARDPVTNEIIVAGISTSLTDTTGTVGGEGIAQPTGGITRGAALANSTITLNSAGSADVFIAQAAFTGQFTVPSDGFLSITAPYSLLLTANTTSPGEFAFVDGLVGLFLSDFGTGDPISSDPRYQFLLVNDGGSDIYSDGGTLQLLNIPLSTLIVYDFEASASTVASATAVPEPGTLLLLATGLIGLIGLRKKFKK